MFTENKHYIVDTDTGCHEWFRANINGYGVVRIGGKNKLAHRVAYERRYGSFEQKLFVCHKCDNPCCINPEHLFLGTNSDNMKDMYSKKRRIPVGNTINHATGENNGRCVVSNNNVKKLRKLFSLGVYTRRDLYLLTNLCSYRQICSLLSTNKRIVL